MLEVSIKQTQKGKKSKEKRGTASIRTEIDEPVQPETPGALETPTRIASR